MEKAKISLLLSSKYKIMDAAETEDEEDIMAFGPHLIDNLKMKVKIMLEYWHDFDRQWAPPNL